MSDRVVLVDPSDFQPWSNAKPFPVTGGTGGGGGGGGTVTQGPSGTDPWKVTGTITANQGGAWTVSLASGTTVALGAGSATIGSIANTAFGISGTLPAFATTPTFNLGTAPTLTVQGTVQAAQSGTWTVSLASGTAVQVSNLPATQAVSGAAGSFVDGADATQGSKADTATTGTGITTAPFSIIQLLKGIYNACVGPTPAGSATIGAVTQASGPWSISWTGQSVTATQGAGSSTNAWFAAVSAVANGAGVSGFSRIPSCAASTNLTTAKASAGRLYKIAGYNTQSTPRRIKLYNAASTAAVTVGTTAVYFSRVLPPGAFSYDMGDIGWTFSSGITYALVAGAADSDATAMAAGDITDLHLEFA